MPVRAIDVSKSRRLLWVLLAGVLVGAALLAVNWLLHDRVKERIGVPMNGRLEKTEEEWRTLLTPEQFRVTRQKGTERAFTGAYWDTKDDGVYRCVCCDQPLLDSRPKLDSGWGWPSFWEPADENGVSLFREGHGFFQRTEVLCSRCDAHLGHVFSDGPPPTGLRYCINSVSLKFVKRADVAKKTTGP